MIATLITTIDPLALAPFVWGLAGLIATRHLERRAVEDAGVEHDDDVAEFRPAA